MNWWAYEQSFLNGERNDFERPTNGGFQSFWLWIGDSDAQDLVERTEGGRELLGLAGISLFYPSSCLLAVLR
jgi:hypothetical protein